MGFYSFAQHRSACFGSFIYCLSIVEHSTRHGMGYARGVGWGNPFVPAFTKFSGYASPLLIYWRNMCLYAKFTRLKVHGGHTSDPLRAFPKTRARNCLGLRRSVVLTFGGDLPDPGFRRQKLYLHKRGKLLCIAFKPRIPERTWRAYHSCCINFEKLSGVVLRMQNSLSSVQRRLRCTRIYISARDTRPYAHVTVRGPRIDVVCIVGFSETDLISFFFTDQPLNVECRLGCEYRPVKQRQLSSMIATT